MGHTARRLQRHASTSIVLVMSEPPILTTELLEELEDRWRAVRLPVLDTLRPGLSREQMDAVVGPLGLELPPEAQVWWGWHDGAAEARVLARERFVKPGVEFLSLSELADWYTSSRAFLDEDLEEGADYLWPANYFCLLRQDSGNVTFDCTDSGSRYSPLYFNDFYDTVPERDYVTPVARSVGEMVTWWIEAWDDGAWGHDPETGWTIDFDRIDRAREHLV